MSNFGGMNFNSMSFKTDKCYTGLSSNFKGIGSVNTIPTSSFNCFDSNTINKNYKKQLDIDSKKEFKHDIKSAVRKLASDTSISVSHGPITVTKQLKGPNDPEKDAYRNCSNCKRHINYHKDGKCPDKK